MENGTCMIVEYTGRERRDELNVYKHNESTGRRKDVCAVNWLVSALIIISLVQLPIHLG